MSQADREEEALCYHQQFGVFRETHKVRDFRLVLYADIWHRAGEYLVRVLVEAVAAERAKGGFDNFFPEPSVIYRPREFQGDLSEDFRAVRSPVFLAELRAVGGA